jgi:hypothetical protein
LKEKTTQARAVSWGKERVEAERGVALETWSGVDLFIILSGACFGNAAKGPHSLG